MTTAGSKRPREQHAPATNGLTVLHRSRLVPWNVAAVTSVAACPDGSVFAAGYDDGKVEVFDATLFTCLARIPGADGTEISSVAWARAPGDPHWRLFASTLDGSILELSCCQLQAIAVTDSFGGPIWSLKAAPASDSSSAGGTVTQLAAACGDGSVKLFAVHGNAPGAEYVRSLPRGPRCRPRPTTTSTARGPGCWFTQQRLESPASRLTAAGTELQRITVGTSSSSPPCVWSLLVLPDGTIVSGDQEGAVQFWDGSFGTLLSRQQHFVGDVLALAASPDGSTVWASGVDPRVALFHLVPDKVTGGLRWLFLDQRSPHSHDVRCLAVLTRPDSHPLLISGRPAQQQPLVQQEAGGQFEGDHWDLLALPQQLATITTNSKQHILAAALSPDASAVAVLAVVTAAGIELLSAAGLQHRGRVHLVSDAAAVTAVGFSPNSKFIAVATASNSVTAYSVETGMPTQWTLKNHGALAELLQHLPGSIMGLSFRPTPAEPLSLLLHSAGGMCHVDMAAALPLYKPPEKVARHKQNPALPQASPLGEVGRNGRLLLLQHPCLLLEYLSATEALLLEKPWQDVLSQLMPPLYRHRYGS
eukprot:gene1961-2288_t